jgi:hypothetical protein
VRFCLPLMAIVVIGGCSPEPVVVDNGPQISRAYAAAGFDGVALNTADTVRVTQGEGFQVTASGSKTMLDYLEISSISNVLVIERKRGNNLVANGKGIIITVKMPMIQRAVIEGSGDMEITAPATGNFAGAVSGSGNMTITQLRADAASFASTGSGAITAAGTLASAKIAASGSGDVSVRGTDKCAIAKSGSGKVSCGR